MLDGLDSSGVDGVSKLSNDFLISSNIRRRFSEPLDDSPDPLRTKSPRGECLCEALLGISTTGRCCWSIGRALLSSCVASSSLLITMIGVSGSSAMIGRRGVFFGCGDGGGGGGFFFAIILWKKSDFNSRNAFEWSVQCIRY